MNGRAGVTVADHMIAWIAPLFGVGPWVAVDVLGVSRPLGGLTRWWRLPGAGPAAWLRPDTANVYGAPFQVWVYPPSWGYDGTAGMSWADALIYVRIRRARRMAVAVACIVSLCAAVGIGLYYS